jgi:hypothetical protein
MSAVRVTMTTLFAVVLLTTAACGQNSGTQAGGSVTPTSPGDSGAASDGAAGRADLTIVVNDGRGSTTTWHLTCSPAGGDHPTPAKACATLAEHGATALPPVPPDRMCSQLYGGPHTAHITGTWQGKPVNATFSRTDGCQTARWDALVGLLPSANA